MKLNPSKNNMLYLERKSQKQNSSFPLLKVKDENDWLHVFWWG